MSKKQSKSIVPVIIFSAIIGIGVFTLVASFAATPSTETNVTVQDIEPSGVLRQSVIDAATELSTK
jgi:hypothetical protein